MTGEFINMTRTLNKYKIWVPDRNRTHDLPNTELRFCLCSTLVSCWSIFTFHKTVLTARKLKARGMRKEIFLFHMLLVFYSPFLLCLFHVFRWPEEIAVLWREKQIYSVKRAYAKGRIKLFSRHWSSWSLEPYKSCWVGHFIWLKTSTCLIIVCISIQDSSLLEGILSIASIPSDTVLIKQGDVVRETAIYSKDTQTTNSWTFFECFMTRQCKLLASSKKINVFTM